MTSPVSTPARSARTTKWRSGSSWRARSTSATSAAATRISVWSPAGWPGPASWSPKRRSRRARSARSTLHALRDGRADLPVRPMAATVDDELPELHHPVHEPLRTGRAAGDVDVDGEDPVDPLDRGVAPLVPAAGARAVAHRDD